MTKQELSMDLYNMVSNSVPGNKYVQYHLFGIKYAEIIKVANFSIEEIVEDAGIPKSIASEIRKGMKLSNFVELKTKD